MHLDRFVKQRLGDFGAEDRLVERQGSGLFVVIISDFYFRHVSLKRRFYFLLLLLTGSAGFSFLAVRLIERWISTRPFWLPGTAPFMKIIFSAGRTSTTSRPSVVICLFPMWPGIPMFFQARDGKELAPMEPGRRWNVEPSVAGPPRIWIRFITPR